MVKKLAAAAVFLFAGVFSAFILWGVLIRPETYDGLVALIDENIRTVLRLTGASTAASAAVSLIPGDTATPIAEKLADFSTYFLIVLSVLYLEKFLIILSGAFGFSCLIPAACASGIAAVLSGSRFFRQLAYRLAVFGIAVILVIPVSVTVSDVIYDYNRQKIDFTLDSASNFSSDLQGEVEKENEATGFMENLADAVTEKFSLAIDGAEKIVSRFIESLAIMIVVSCLVPLLVLLCFLWLLKITFNVPVEHIHLPGPPRRHGKPAAG